ncbi:hypothetical protein Bbelb_181540 [Branchiostoma belcheri]|nr:hypothetical protein Bbelb_181540 [Branchiostoma belcheri]
MGASELQDIAGFFTPPLAENVTSQTTWFKDGTAEVRGVSHSALAPVVRRTLHAWKVVKLGGGRGADTGSTSDNIAPRHAASRMRLEHLMLPGLGEVPSLVSNIVWESQMSRSANDGGGVSGLYPRPYRGGMSGSPADTHTEPPS